MFIILLFFFCQWFLSLFFSSFFLHRFSSLQLYTTTKEVNNYNAFSCALSALDSN
jgi:hypothetical protein